MYKIPKSKKIASFDLYDTVVIRRALSANALYRTVWESLCDRGYELPDCASYIDMRVKADVDSKFIDAPTLKQILGQLGDKLIGFADVIESVEIEIELDQLRVIPGAEKRVLDARKNEFQIVYLSDMHIGATHLEKKLRSLELFQENDILVVSSDHSVSKSRGGKLFKHFINSNNLEGHSITHFGNNEWSDVKMAVKNGVVGRYCPIANPNRFESILIDESKYCSELDDVASFSRDTRLRFGNSGAKPTDEINWKEESVCDIASSVAAPVLTTFVTWVVNQCKQESISTIRFLMRDGELLHQIARALPEELTDSLDLDILEVSRRSLMLPAASVMPMDDWLDAGLNDSYLIQKYDLLPAEQIVCRVGLSFTKHAELLRKYNIVDADKPLASEGLINWKNALQDEDIRLEIQKESKKRLEVTSAYLRQQLADCSGRVAFVDIGWTGQQAAMLSSLVLSLGKPDPLHLLVGRLRDRRLAAPADIRGWLFEEKVKPSPVENPVALFESFCATTLGGVDGYRILDDGSVAAVKREQLHEAELVSWGQPTVRKCIVSFAETAGAVIQHLDSEVLKSICEKLLQEFWNNPNRAEAVKWGAFPYEQDQAGLSVKKLVNPYNLAQLKSRLNGSYGGADWKAGSIVLSPNPIRQLLKVWEKYRRIRNKIK